MLDKSEERVKLLRKGLSQKQIEKLYINENNFKIVNPNLLFELFESDAGNIRKMPVNCEAAIDHAQSDIVTSIWNLYTSYNTSLWDFCKYWNPSLRNIFFQTNH